MTAQQVLAELKKLGTEQNRKIYRRHGVSGEQHGVSYAHLKQLKKRLKTDHALALRLWASGNHDARVLATFVADPKQADEQLLDAWAADLDSYPLTDAFSAFAARTALARRKMEQWTASDEEWTGQAGWDLLAHLATREDALPDAFFEPYLATVERGIHTRKNRVRHAMNNALIAIGVRSDALEQKALAVARKIGTVEVDHGQTSCKTPDAAAYIRKTRRRQQARAGRS